jgi:hypothetical protein
VARDLEPLAADGDDRPQLGQRLAQGRAVAVILYGRQRPASPIASINPRSSSRAIAP